MNERLQSAVNEWLLQAVPGGVGVVADLANVRLVAAEGRALAWKGRFRRRATATAENAAGTSGRGLDRRHVVHREWLRRAAEQENHQGQVLAHVDQRMHRKGQK